MTVFELPNLHIEVQLEGRRLRGLPTGCPARGLNAAQFGTAVGSVAYVGVGPEAQPWPIERLVAHGGRLYLCGPWIDGPTLHELLVSSGGVPPSAGHVARVPIGELIAAATDSAYSVANTLSTVVTEQGHLVRLPQQTARQINTGMTAEWRAFAIDPYAAPALPETASALYCAAAIVYHAVCGVPPCPPQSSAAVECAYAPKAPVHTHRPACLNELAQAIDAALNPPTQTGASPPPTAIWNDVATWRAEDVARRIDEPVDTATADERRAAAQAAFDRAGKRSRRETFWRRNRTRLLVGAIVAAVVLSVPVTMLRNALQPPVTAGLEPQELVEGLYAAWTERDHLFLEDAFAKGVASNLIREVTNVYVVGRMQMATTFQSNIVSPTEWNQSGRAAGTSPYGVTDLVITVVSTDPYVVQADYHMWRPEPGATEAFAVATATRDRLRLEPSRHGWVVVEYESTDLHEVERVPLRL